MLALLLLLLSTACTPSDPSGPDTADPDASVDTSADTKSPDPEATTEDVTLPAPEDYEITERDGVATITTPLGLTYTVTGYTALDKAAATLGGSLTYTFGDEAFEEKFNRFTLTYAATAPVKIWVTYTERGKTLKIEYMIPTECSQSSYQSDIFLCGNHSMGSRSLPIPHAEAVPPDRFGFFYLFPQSP